MRPSCGTCGVYKVCRQTVHIHTLIVQDDCQWDSREDYRKPLPRQQVQALVTRVDYLERLLKEHGIETGPTGSRLHSLDHGRDVTQDQDRRDGLEGGDTSRDLSLDHLVGLISLYYDAQDVHSYSGRARRWQCLSTWAYFRLPSSRQASPRSVQWTEHLFNADIAWPATIRTLAVPSGRDSAFSGGT